MSDTNRNHTFPLNVMTVECAELLSVQNPNCTEMIHRYQYLKGVKIENTDRKSLLPIHVILGASDYAKWKTWEAQRTGAIGEPVTEYTCFGWAIMLPGSEADFDSMFLVQTASSDWTALQDERHWTWRLP